MKTLAELIAVERQRRITEEGWNEEHDDAQVGGELAHAAACYAMPRELFVEYHYSAGFHFRDPWPWDAKEDMRRPGAPGQLSYAIPTKGPERIEMLVRAAALLEAEIDRLQRAEGVADDE